MTAPEIENLDFVLRVWILIDTIRRTVTKLMQNSWQRLNAFKIDLNMLKDFEMI